MIMYKSELTNIWQVLFKKEKKLLLLLLLLLSVYNSRLNSQTQRSRGVHRQILALSRYSADLCLSLLIYRMSIHIVPGKVQGSSPDKHWPSHPCPYKAYPTHPDQDGTILLWLSHSVCSQSHRHFGLYMMCLVLPTRAHNGSSLRGWC